MKSIAGLLLLAATCAAAPLEVPAYRTKLDGQDVVLVPVESYRTLVAPPELPVRAAPAPEKKVVAPDRITRVHVQGTVTGGRASLDVRCELDLGSDELRQVTLWPELKDLVVTRYRGPGELMPPAGGNCRVITTARGPATVELSVIVPVARVGHAWRLGVPMPPAPQQTVDLFLAGEKELSVRAENGLVLSSAAGAGGVRVRAAGRGEQGLALRWEAPVQVEAAPEVGAPAEQEFEPELSVQVATLAAVGDTHLKMRSTVSITVRRNPVREIVLAAGGTASFVDISGPQVAEWESSLERGMQVAHISLRGAVQDKVDLQVEYEMPMTETGAKPGTGPTLKASFVPVHVPASYQEDHSLGVSRPPCLDLGVTPGGEWRELDPARVPPSLAALTGQTLARLMQCERFPRARRAEPPAPIELACSRLDEVQLLQATIDVMDAQTALTEDGHLLGRVTCKVRNNSQQFLRLKAPAGAVPLTVYVAGKAVRAASDEKGRWLIPLGKSGRTASGAAPFDVQVTYLQQDQGALVAGRTLKLSLPQADLGISTVRWKVALPKDWSLTTRATNMRPEPSYRPVEFAGGDAASGSAPAALFDEATLPLAIELPKVPEIFHFSQDLLDKEAEPRQVEITLSRAVPELTRRAGAFLLGVLFFYIVLRGRPEGRKRATATAVAIVGTGLLMALFGWASATLGLTLHLALGLFMGTVIFGISRLAVAFAAPAAVLEED